MTPGGIDLEWEGTLASHSRLYMTYSTRLHISRVETGWIGLDGLGLGLGCLGLVLHSAQSVYQ
jgi:hypothetical protein